MALIHLVGGQEQGFFKGCKKLLVWLGITDSNQIMLGAGTNGRLTTCTATQGHGHTHTIPIQLCGTDGAQYIVCYIHHKPKILQCGNNGAQQFIIVGGIKCPRLYCPQGNLAFICK